jgi:uncharacterized membrane protein
MNPSLHHNLAGEPASKAAAADAATDAAEETLRLIAHLPAPQGLEARVQAALQSAPRQARVLAWPAAPQWVNGWMRTAAAATIALVVAGGGWGVFSRVQPGQAVKSLPAPPHVAAPSGFSSAGAMRTPQTLNGPAAPQPAAPGSATAGSAAGSALKPTPAPFHRGQSASGKKAAGQNTQRGPKRSPERVPE